MSILHYLPYLLLFMVATMLIYGWGLWRASRQQRDLMNMLYSKAVSKIKKAIKQKGPLSKKEIQEVVKNIQVSQPFSKNRLGVTDKVSFTTAILSFMMENDMLIKEKENGTALRNAKSSVGFWLNPKTSW